MKGFYTVIVQLVTALLETPECIEVGTQPAFILPASPDRCHRHQLQHTL